MLFGCSNPPSCGVSAAHGLPTLHTPRGQAVPDWRCKGHTVSCPSGNHTPTASEIPGSVWLAIQWLSLRHGHAVTSVLGACHNTYDVLQQFSIAVHGLLGMQADWSSNNLTGGVSEEAASRASGLHVLAACLGGHMGWKGCLCHKAGAVAWRRSIFWPLCSILGCTQQHGKLSHLHTLPVHACTVSLASVPTCSCKGHQNWPSPW